MRALRLACLAVASPFLLLVVSTGRLFAFDDWQPISPVELKMTSEPSQPGAAAVILYREESSDDNENYRYNYYRIKILTEEGKKYADVKIPFNNEYFHISDVKGRTIHVDGSVVPFEGKLLDATLLKGRGVKILQKAFTLPDVQVGSIIEYKYKMRWEKGTVWAPSWAVQEDLFQKHAKFGFIPFKGEVEVKGGGGTQVAWTSQYLPKNSPIKHEREHVTLELNDVPAYVDEEYSPPADQFKMRVRFYYTSSDVKTADTYWEREGKDWSKELEKFVSHHQAIDDQVRQLIGTGDTSDQKLRKLYARVQQMTNLSYQRERTAAEQKTDNLKYKYADDVFRQNTGYHNQLTRVFIAMARSAGFDAHGVRVSSRDEVFFNEQILDFDQLSSEVAQIVVEGKKVYLDPGTRYCPFGLLDWRRTSARGLAQVGKDKTEFVDTPPPDMRTALTQRGASFTMAQDGSLKGKVRLIFNGQEALIHRLEENESDEAERAKSLEEELRRMLPATATIHLDSAKGWSGQDDPVDATFSVEIPGYATATGKRLLLPTNLFESQSKQPFVHDKRATPVYFQYPFRTLDRIVITVPPSLQIESLPKQHKLFQDSAAYATSYELQGKQILIKREFDQNGFAFPTDYYSTLKSFYEQVKTGDEDTAILRPDAIAQN